MSTEIPPVLPVPQKVHDDNYPLHHHHGWFHWVSVHDLLSPPSPSISLVFSVHCLVLPGLHSGSLYATPRTRNHFHFHVVFISWDSRLRQERVPFRIERPEKHGECTSLWRHRPVWVSLVFSVFSVLLSMHVSMCQRVT